MRIKMYVCGRLIKIPIVFYICTYGTCVVYSNSCTNENAFQVYLVWSMSGTASQYQKQISKRLLKCWHIAYVCVVLEFWVSLSIRNIDFHLWTHPIYFQYVLIGHILFQLYSIFSLALLSFYFCPKHSISNFCCKCIMHLTKNVTLISNNNNSIDTHLIWFEEVLIFLLYLGIVQRILFEFGQ